MLPAGFKPAVFRLTKFGAQWLTDELTNLVLHYKTLKNKFALECRNAAASYSKSSNNSSTWGFKSHRTMLSTDDATTTRLTTTFQMHVVLGQYMTAKFFCNNIHQHLLWQKLWNKNQKSKLSKFVQLLYLIKIIKVCSKTFMWYLEH